MTGFNKIKIKVFVKIENNSIWIWFLQQSMVMARVLEWHVGKGDHRVRRGVHEVVTHQGLRWKGIWGLPVELRVRLEFRGGLIQLHLRSREPKQTKKG